MKHFPAYKEVWQSDLCGYTDGLTSIDIVLLESHTHRLLTADVRVEEAYLGISSACYLT